MTLEELYKNIEGDYAQAVKVLRMDKLIDKHIRKMADNTLTASLVSASETMNGQEMFDAAHALKGICANLGLVKMADLSSVIAEEFRTGNPRTMSDEEVRRTVSEIHLLFEKTAESIRGYISEN